MNVQSQLQVLALLLSIVMMTYTPPCKVEAVDASRSVQPFASPTGSTASLPKCHALSQAPPTQVRRPREALKAES